MSNVKRIYYSPKVSITMVDNKIISIVCSVSKDLAILICLTNFQSSLQFPLQGAVEYLPGTITNEEDKVAI